MTLADICHWGGDFEHLMTPMSSKVFSLFLNKIKLHIRMNRKKAFCRRHPGRSTVTSRVTNTRVQRIMTNISVNTLPGIRRYSIEYRSIYLLLLKQVSNNSPLNDAHGVHQCINFDTLWGIYTLANYQLHAKQMSVMIWIQYLTEYRLTDNQYLISFKVQ